MDDLTFGVVVLSAKQAISIPMLPQSRLSDHISGSVFHGRAGGTAKFASKIYLPARGREYALTSNVSSFEEFDYVSDVAEKELSNNQDFRGHFASVCSKHFSVGSHLAFTQVLPFGMVGLHSNEGGLRIFGVHSKTCELLVWCNTPDVDRIFQSGDRKEWVIHRFKDRSSFTSVVFTSRVCQRWHRWTKNGLTADLKFQALEVALFSHEHELHTAATPERPGSEEDQR